MTRAIILRSLFSVMVLLTMRTAPVAAQAGNGTDRDATFSLYPNPNKGDQVHVLLGGLDPEIREVAFDLYDLRGCVAMTRMLTVNQGSVDLVLNFDGDLPNGMYLANVTVGSRQLSQRLVVAHQ